MESAFRIALFVLPFLLILAGYFWIGRKAMAESRSVYKVLALAVMAAGLAYTIWTFVILLSGPFEEYNFNFTVLIANIFILFAVSIILTLAKKGDD